MIQSTIRWELVEWGRMVAVCHTLSHKKINTPTFNHSDSDLLLRIILSTSISIFRFCLGSSWTVTITTGPCVLSECLFARIIHTSIHLCLPFLLRVILNSCDIHCGTVLSECLFARIIHTSIHLRLPFLLRVILNSCDIHCGTSSPCSFIWVSFCTYCFVILSVSNSFS